MMEIKMYDVLQESILPPNIIEMWRDLDFNDGEVHTCTVPEYVGLTEEDDLPLEMVVEQTCEILKKARGKKRVKVGDKIGFRVTW